MRNPPSKRMAAALGIIAGCAIVLLASPFMAAATKPGPRQTDCRQQLVDAMDQAKQRVALALDGECSIPPVGGDPELTTQQLEEIHTAIGEFVEFITQE